MKTKSYLPLSIRHGAHLTFFVILTLLAHFTTSPQTLAQAPWGNALLLDGTDDYVLAGSVPLANSSFTVEAWARRDTNSTMNMIVTQGGPGLYNALLFGFHWDWVGFVFDFYGDGVVSQNIDNIWHHWAGVYDASSRLSSLYRDGVLQGTKVTAQHYQGSGPLVIGRQLFEFPANFNGSIDDVRIWSVARTQAEIQMTMGHPLTGSELNLLAYWKFDEQSGTNVLDATGHGYDGQLMNDPILTASTVPSVEFTAFSIPAPGMIRLEANGSAGLIYTLQSSSNMIDWVDLASVDPYPDGFIEFEVETETSAPNYFFRLKWP